MLGINEAYFSWCHPFLKETKGFRLCTCSLFYCTVCLTPKLQSSQNAKNVWSLFRNIATRRQTLLNDHYLIAKQMKFLDNIRFVMQLNKAEGWTFHFSCLRMLSYIMHWDKCRMKPANTPLTHIQNILCSSLFRYSSSKNIIFL